VPDTTTITRNADALDAEVGRLRTQARALHTARADATKASDTKWGGLRDDAARDADAARHASARALEQANQQHESASGFQQNARALEVTADQEAAAGNHQRAAELREDAQEQRALAVAADERSARAHKAAADQTARADDLEQQVRDYDKRITGTGDENTPAIERVADQLDEKAELLSRAADQQRAAVRYEAEGNAEAAARASQGAASALASADAIQPAYASVDAAVLMGAGITTAGPDGPDDEGSRGRPDDSDDRSGIDPSDTLNPFDDSDVTGARSSLDEPATGESPDGTDEADPTATASAEGLDPSEAGADFGTALDPGADTFASPTGFDATAMSTFDDPVPSDDGFQDFGAADDTVASVGADDGSFDFDA
jgi:hypothetical protein